MLSFSRSDNAKPLQRVAPTCEVGLSDGVLIGRFFSNQLVVTIPLKDPIALGVRDVGGGSEDPFELCIRTGSLGLDGPHSLGLDGPQQILNRYVSREQAFTDLDEFYVALASRRSSRPVSRRRGAFLRWGGGIAAVVMVLFGLASILPTPPAARVAGPAAQVLAGPPAPIVRPQVQQGIWSNVPAGAPQDADEILKH